MEGRQTRINWTKEPHCQQLDDALKDYYSRDKKPSINQFAKEKDIHRSVLERHLKKNKQQNIQQKIQQIKQELDQNLGDMIKRGGGQLGYEPIEHNIWPKRQTQTRKQPARATKKARSPLVDEGEHAESFTSQCTCKYDGKKCCVIGECGNDNSNKDCHEHICSFKDINCGNRRHLRPYLTSCVPKKCKKLEGHELNMGLVAFEGIPKGVFIGQYVGVIKDKKHSSGDYCAALRKVGGQSFVVDAGEKGNLTRLINHSCDNNCEMIAREVMGDEQIWIKSLQTIDPDEELTINYKWTQKEFKGRCLCGSVNCKYKQRRKRSG